jgi:hypothetical protein
MRLIARLVGVRAAANRASCGSRQFTARIAGMSCDRLPQPATLKTAHALRASRAAAQPFRAFDREMRSYAGTPAARVLRMAAVFALVFLFVLASGGVLISTMLDGASFASVFALATFLALASGVFVGLFKMARRWESEAGH